MNTFMRHNFGFAYVFLSCLGCFALSIVHSTGVPYLEHFGLSKLECNRMNEICHLTMFLTCIPAGVFADVFGRRMITISGNLLIALGSLIYGASRTMSGFMLAEAIFGVGLALGGSAFQAWMVDKHLKSARGNYGQTITLTFVFGSSVRVLGSFLGAQLANLSIFAPWFLLSALLTTEAILLCVWMEDGEMVPKDSADAITSVSGRMRAILMKGLAYALTHRATRLIFLLCGLQLLAYKASDMQWAPCFQAFGLDGRALGIVGALICAAGALGSLLAKKTRELKLLGEATCLVTLSILIGSTLALAGIANGSLFICGSSFFVCQIMRGWWNTTASISLNHHIPSESRATILSAYSMFSVLMSLFGLEFGGQIAENMSIASSWTIGGLVCIIGSFFLRRL